MASSSKQPSSNPSGQSKSSSSHGKMASKSSESPYLYKQVTLLSTSDVRYDGGLYIIDLDARTIALQHVRCLGTEGRRKGDQAIAASNCTYEFIIFRAENIKQLCLTNPDDSMTGNPDLTHELLEPLRRGASSGGDRQSSSRSSSSSSGSAQHRRSRQSKSSHHSRQRQMPPSQSSSSRKTRSSRDPSGRSQRPTSSTTGVANGQIDPYDENYRRSRDAGASANPAYRGGRPATTTSAAAGHSSSGNPYSNRSGRPSSGATSGRYGYGGGRRFHDRRRVVGVDRAPLPMGGGGGHDQRNRHFYGGGRGGGSRGGGGYYRDHGWNGGHPPAGGYRPDYVYPHRNPYPGYDDRLPPYRGPPPFRANPHRRFRGGGGMYRGNRRFNRNRSGLKAGTGEYLGDRRLNGEEINVSKDAMFDFENAKQKADALNKTNLVNGASGGGGGPSKEISEQSGSTKTGDDESGGGGGGDVGAATESEVKVSNVDDAKNDGTPPVATVSHTDGAAYDKSKSFFDDLTLDVQTRGVSREQRMAAVKQMRETDTSTFGTIGDRYRSSHRRRFSRQAPGGYTRSRRYGNADGSANQSGGHRRNHGGGRGGGGRLANSSNTHPVGGVPPSSGVPSTGVWQARTAH